MEVIVGLMAGLQAAFVHLGNVLDQRGVIAKSDLAKSFEATAQGLSADLGAAPAIQLVLRQIAQGLQQSHMPAEQGEQIRQLLH